MVLGREREEAGDGLGCRLWNHSHGMDLNPGSTTTYQLWYLGAGVVIQLLCASVPSLSFQAE